MRNETLACSALALLLAGCAGNGQGLDENGRPAGEPGVPVGGTFASVQANVFTAYCTGCHAGAAAPVGLRLTEDVSFAALVNTPSVESPATLRVAPGNPNASYLLQKISGTAAVGGRMPLGGPPLPAELIASVGQWIQDGARPTTQAAPAGAAALSAVFPAPGATLQTHAALLADATPGPIVIAADVALDATSLLPNAVTLVRSGGDGGFADGNEVTVAQLQIEVRSLDPTTFAVTSLEPWVADRYRLTVIGTGDTPVRDLRGVAADGDRNGTPGGDLVLEFDVLEAR